MRVFLVINIKMPTIVGILIFISRKNFMLSLVEYEKSFMTSEPDCQQDSRQISEKPD